MPLVNGVYRFTLSAEDLQNKPSLTPIVCNLSYSNQVDILSDTKVATASSLKVDLTEGFNEEISPRSVRFMLGNDTIVDTMGSLYKNPSPTSGVGVLCGTLNYQTGIATLSTWTPNTNNTVVLQSLLTSIAGQGVSSFAFRTAQTPLRPSSLNITATKVEGGTIVVVPDQDGKINTPDAQGVVNTEYGLCELIFKRKTLLNQEALDRLVSQPWFNTESTYIEGAATYVDEPIFVRPETVKYSAVSFSYMPLDADLIGLDPVRLPNDGKVPFLRVGNPVLIHRTQTITVPSPAVGAEYQADKYRLKHFRAFDLNGVPVDPTMYEVDLVAGTLTLLTTFDPSGYALPLSLEARIEDFAVIRDVQINGDVTLGTPLTHDYPDNTYLSSVMLVGDIQSRAFNVFSQQSWTGAWSDTRIGNAITAQYNNALSPIRTVNKGAIDERWTVQFTGNTSFKVFGETVGELPNGGQIGYDFTAINPMNNEPYFTIPALGWGSGWVSNNVLRFNTESCSVPIWAVRTVQQGASTVEEDEFELQARIGVNRNRA